MVDVETTTAVSSTTVVPIIRMKTTTFRRLHHCFQNGCIKNNTTNHMIGIVITKRFFNFYFFLSLLLHTTTAYSYIQQQGKPYTTFFLNNHNKETNKRYEKYERIQQQQQQQQRKDHNNARRKMNILVRRATRINNHVVNVVNQEEQKPTYLHLQQQYQHQEQQQQQQHRRQFLSTLCVTTSSLIFVPPFASADSSSPFVAATTTAVTTLSSSSNLETIGKDPNCLDSTCLGVWDGLFADCPHNTNNNNMISFFGNKNTCVSSQDDTPGNFMEPWDYSSIKISSNNNNIKNSYSVSDIANQWEQQMDTLITTLQLLYNKDCIILIRDGRYVRVLFNESSSQSSSSIGEFYFTPNDTTVQFRIAPTTGSIDNNSYNNNINNMKRAELIRTTLQYDKIPVLRNRKRTLFFIESDLDDYGPGSSGILLESLIGKKNSDLNPTNIQPNETNENNKNTPSSQTRKQQSQKPTSLLDDFLYSRSD